ncbi:UNVERIFIED_CONTAM: hypothetical protein RMT77_016418 [Armadillidium vulgare]|nr:General transcription factor IIH subunit 3 [Armadillidium vulgare]
MASTSASDSEEGCLLVIILDVHPCLASNEGEAEVYLNTVTAFANLHLASSGANRLAIIAANHAQTCYLYPDQSHEEVERQIDGRLELLSHVDKILHQNLKKMMVTTTVFTQSESLIAGALGRALTYVRRIESEDGLNKKINARILVIKVSTDAGGQYLNYVNMYLTAQKMRLPVDMCVIGSDCGLLQQGADITGGLYYKVNSVDKLMQSLMMIFMPNLDSRRRLALPPSGSVDYRAACFCHRSLVDMAHVCSNCLSVYCKAVPLCSTCNALFGMEMPIRKPPKKKKND